MIKGIIARFIPLCDISICVLGLMLILSAFANYDQTRLNVQSPVSAYYFYCHPDKDPLKLSLINPKAKSEDEYLKEFDITSDKDYNKLILENKYTDEDIIFFYLCSKKDDDDFRWTNDVMEKIKEKWGIKDEGNRKIQRLINVPVEWKSNKKEEGNK
ncbi:MAG: hypothetical protein LBU65_16950 [Planctomycetaceae bacterium]|jgi:hypothetical protein|nr:hypothetical protein [Planctomycetaceae bacterium]